jgi:hypothetical protein
VVGGPTKGTPAVREVLPLSESQRVFVTTRWGLPPSVPATPEALKTVLEPDLAVPARPAPPEAGELPEDLPGDLTERARADAELLRRAAGDEALVRAVDALLALRALGMRRHATDTAHNAAPAGTP